MGVVIQNPDLHDDAQDAGAEVRAIGLCACSV